MNTTALTTEELVEQAKQDPKQLNPEQRAEVADQVVPGLQGKMREAWIAEGLSGQEQTKEAEKVIQSKQASAKRNRAVSNGSATSAEDVEAALKAFVEAKGSTAADAPKQGVPFVEGGKLHVRAKYLAGFLGKKAPADLKSALKALSSERVVVGGLGHYVLPPAVTKRVAKGLAKREAPKAAAKPPKNKAATPAKNKGGTSPRKPRGATSQRKAASKSSKK